VAGLFSMVIVLKKSFSRNDGFIGDRVSEVLTVLSSALVLRRGELLQRVCGGYDPGGGRTIHLLSAERILLESERQILFDFQAAAQDACTCGKKPDEFDGSCGGRALSRPCSSTIRSTHA